MIDRAHPSRGLRQAMLALSSAFVLGLVVIAMSASRIGIIGYSAVDNLLQHASKAPCCRLGSGGSLVLPTLNAPWLGIAVGVVIAAVVVSAWQLSGAHHRRAMPAVSEEGAAAAQPDLARRAPGNPREAVIAAFADLEDSLTAVGLGRLPSEVPESYLKRALPRALRMSPARTTLLKLYAVARYSERSIDGASAERAKIAAAELGRGVRTQFVMAPPSPSDPGLQLE
jgi:hypothetical protein